MTFLSTGKGLWVSTIIGLFVILVVWDQVSGGITSEILLPSPMAVAKAMLEVPSSHNFLSQLWATLQELAIGFALGAGSGVLLGFLCTFSSLFRRALRPYIVFFQAIPKVALVPLIFTWFGWGIASKVVLAAMVAFFPAFVNTMLGLTLLPEPGVRLMYSLGASRWQRFKMLQLPSAIPLTFAGIKTALTYAFVGVIVAEFLGGALGLGSLIQTFNERIRVDKAFAIIVYLSILALIIFYGIEWLGRRLVFWEKGEGQMPTL